MSANQSLAMYPMLTQGAYGALLATGAPWMKEQIAPKMVSGEWAGTMCLTEPGCGTDLRLMKTRAVEQPDGTYRMNGTKIFISGGDQDLTNNIIHMVIAKIPDADGQLLSMLVCMYTNSPDSHFIVDRHPRHDDAGCRWRGGLAARARVGMLRADRRFLRLPRRRDRATGPWSRENRAAPVRRAPPGAECWRT